MTASISPTKSSPPPVKELKSTGSYEKTAEKIDIESSAFIPKGSASTISRKITSSSIEKKVSSVEREKSFHFVSFVKKVLDKYRE